MMSEQRQDVPSLDEFMREHEHERHRLVMRKLRGEPLSAHEEAVLQSINERLEQLLPAPERMPDDVAKAVNEAWRLSKLRRSSG
jgi:hypothetical protein